MQPSSEPPGLGDDAASASGAPAGPEAAGAGAGPDAPDSAPDARAPEGDAPAATKPPGPPGKRERILRAATELFAERDFHRVLMDDVAERAGVGKGTLYRYFETKEDLFVAALGFAVDVTAGRLRAKLEGLADPVERLRVACKQALRFFRENDHLFHVLHHHKAIGSEAARAELAEKQRGLRHFAEHVIADGVAAGAFDCADPGFASTILWGMIRTTLRNSSPGDVLEDLAGRIVDLLVKGIARR